MKIGVLGAGAVLGFFMVLMVFLLGKIPLTAILLHELIGPED